MELESKTAVSWSTLSAAALSKDGDLAVMEVGLVGVATPRLYRRDQPDRVDSVHQQDQAGFKAEVSVVVSVAHAVASEAASAATEEVSVAVEASATRAEAALADDLTALVARHHPQMLHLVQAVVVAAVLVLVGMVEVLMVAHP